MSAPYDCFEYLFGLSQTDCDCYGADKPSDFATSASGLYLDQVPGINLNMVRGAVNCESLWAMLARARSEATKQIKADLMACQARGAQYRRIPVTGTIGEVRKVSQGITLTRPYHGMTVELAAMKGGTATLTRIAACFKTSGNVTVQVWDQEGDVPIASHTISAIANKATWYDLPTPLVLDMDAQGARHKRYWFLYQPTPGQDAMYTQLHCGCGGMAFRPSWSVDAPAYDSSVNKGGFAWANWAQATGFHGTDITKREFIGGGWSWGMIDTQGLMLQFAFNCNAAGSLCSDPPNYDTDPFQIMIARTARALAAAKLLHMIQTSGNANYYTNLEGDTIAALILGFEAEYLDHKDGYLCAEITEQSPDGSINSINKYNDCFICRDNVGMRVATMHR